MYSTHYWVSHTRPRMRHVNTHSPRITAELILGEFNGASGRCGNYSFEIMPKFPRNIFVAVQRAAPMGYWQRDYAKIIDHVSACSVLQPPVHTSRRCNSSLHAHPWRERRPSLLYDRTFGANFALSFHALGRAAGRLCRGCNICEESRSLREAPRGAEVA